MSKPIIHAISSAKRFGGVPEDYLAIHDLMDSSKGAIPDNRHRILTHQSWFLKEILERVFGYYLLIPKNEEAHAGLAEIAELEAQIVAKKAALRESGNVRVVPVREIGEQHVLEDFQMRFIPTPQDYAESGEMRLTSWMNNGNSGAPPSHKAIADRRKTERFTFKIDTD